MVNRITSNPEYDDKYCTVKELTETMQAQIDKYLIDVGDMYPWPVRQAARRMLGRNLLHPSNGFVLPPMEEV